MGKVPDRHMIRHFSVFMHVGLEECFGEHRWVKFQEFLVEYLSVFDSLFGEHFWQGKEDEPWRRVT